MKFYNFSFLLQNRSVGYHSHKPLNSSFMCFSRYRFFLGTSINSACVPFRRKTISLPVLPGRLPPAWFFISVATVTFQGPACSYRQTPLASDFRLLLKRSTRTLIAGETLRNNKLTKIVLGTLPEA